MLYRNNGLLTIDEECDMVRITLGDRSYHQSVVPPADLPLPYGDGTYTVQILEHREGNLYRPVKTRRVIARNTEEYLLHYNYIVKKTPGCAYAVRLCEGLEDPAHVYAKVRTWAAANLIYDRVRAATGAAGPDPDPVACWKTRRGVCHDIACLVTGMLRAVGIPARYCVGYADKHYHAWVEANIDGSLRRYDHLVAQGQAQPRAYLRERWY